MLQYIRDRLTGAMVWVIVGLIIVPFAFWGIESFRGGGGDPTVAEVGGVKITQSQFHAAYQQRYLQLRQLMGESFRPDQIDPKKLRQGVLDSMIGETAMQQYARDTGYRTSDAEMLEQIRAIPAFQENGAFTANAYRTALARNGQTPEHFEAQLRDELTAEQIRKAVLSSGFEVPVAVKLRYRIEHQQRSFQYVRIDPQQYMDAVDFTDAQVHAEYDSHQDRYRAPERVKLAYVELSLDKLGQAPQPSKDVLQTLYDADKQSLFSAPEERHAEHILIAFGADKAAAKKKAEDLLAKIKAGADFAALAKQYSDDPGSKAAGGDLGWIRHGMMVAPFESALFSLKEGQVSDPVETPYGWHLIKLLGVHPASTKPFDDAGVQQQLLDMYRKRWASQQFEEDSDKLEQLAFENPSSLDPVAKALGLKVETTGWVTHDTTDGIVATPAVLRAAFSSVVLQDGENSKPLQISPTDLVVIRKLDYEPSHQRSFDEVAGQARDAVKHEAAVERAKSTADALVHAVDQGQTLEAAAKAKDLKVQTLADAGRKQKDVDSQLLDAAFRLPKPADGKTVAGQAPIDKGVIAVIALTAVSDGDADKASDTDMHALLAQMRESQAGAEFTAYQGAVQRIVGSKIVNQPSTEQ